MNHANGKVYELARSITSETGGGGVERRFGDPMGRRFAARL
jgi:hypothetical protein